MTDYPYDFGNGYKIQAVFANKTADGTYGDIYDFRSDVERAHPGAEIMTGYCVIAKARGLIPDRCNDWNDTVSAAIQDYEEHVVPFLDVRLKAINIMWDVDYGQDGTLLPTEIEIPAGMVDQDEITDYLSDVTGFCHEGYTLIEVEEHALADQPHPCRFNLGDKVKIPYISDSNKHNNQIGEVTWIHPYKFYPGGDINNHVWKYQMTITYPDGETEGANPDAKTSGLVSEVVLVERKSSRPPLDDIIQSASTRATESQPTAQLNSKEPAPEL